MQLISQNFYNSKENLNLESLTDRIGLHQDDIFESLNNLVESKIITETNEEPTSYLPAKDLEMITVIDVLKSVRSNSANENFIETNYLTEPVVNDVMNKIDSSIDSAVKEMTFKDLVSKS